MDINESSEFIFTTKIKKDYIYQVKDAKVQCEIIVITNIDYKLREFQGKTIYPCSQKEIEQQDNYCKVGELWHTSLNVISSLPYSDSDSDSGWDDAFYAFYEIGHKDNYPEYFL